MIWSVADHAKLISKWCKKPFFSFRFGSPVLLRICGLCRALSSVSTFINNETVKWLYPQQQWNSQMTLPSTTMKQPNDVTLNNNEAIKWRYPQQRWSSQMTSPSTTTKQSNDVTLNNNEVAKWRCPRQQWSSQMNTPLPLSESVWWWQYRKGTHEPTLSPHTSCELSSPPVPQREKTRRKINQPSKVRRLFECSWINTPF